MNTHNERFNKAIQDMFVSYNEDLLFTDLNEFNWKMAKWLIDYNTILTHTSLGYKTPVEYAIVKVPYVVDADIYLRFFIKTC